MFPRCSAMHPDLLSSRFASVAVSRAREDAEIYTNDAASLGQRFSADAGKSSAVEFSQSVGMSAATDFSIGQSI
jgi:hypothetical protein